MKRALPGGRATLHHLARKTAVGVLGATALAIGVALIALPVPGVAALVVPLGLAILAKEFGWARRSLDRVRGALRWAVRHRPARTRAP